MVYSIIKTYRVRKEVAEYFQLKIILENFKKCLNQLLTEVFLRDYFFFFARFIQFNLPAVTFTLL